MEKGTLEQFFTNLSFRFSKENDLSDFTWALCESHLEFKELFLKFFFSELVDVSEIMIKREFYKDYCRPDMYFEYLNKKFIIEIKKYDRNDHFDQYLTAFPDARFGWIAIYSMKNQSNIEIRTWSAFYHFIEKEIHDISSDEVIQSYLQYLKNICAVIKFKKMRLDNSTYFFNKLIQKIIEQSIDGFNMAIYTASKSIDDFRYGRYFSLNVENSSTVIYPWFGMFYNENTSGIYMGFKRAEGWCKPVCDSVDPKVPILAEYFEQPYFDDDGYNELCFELKDEYFQKLNNSENFEEQEQILASFFTEVILNVKKYLV